MRLHITNGDSAGQLIQRVVASDPVLPWRDILHEGPVPAGLDPVSLAAVRATFLAATGNGAIDTLLASFRDRDAWLARAPDFEGVTLWFEHDLYDQLQLVQVLDRLAQVPSLEGRIGLIQADRYLGCLTVGEIAAARADERPVGPGQLALAREAWAAVRHPTPEAMLTFLTLDSGELPWLAPALRRFLGELPRPGTGLARTEELTLQELARGSQPLSHLYGLVQAQEPAVFMGDEPFFRWVERLAQAPVPLIAGFPPAGLNGQPASDAVSGCVLSLTVAGGRVLGGEADWLDLHKLGRWLGGTWLSGPAAWRWDAASERLVRNGASP